MASREHSLDDGIVRAARAEFLRCGFRNASLHRIAENAHVTTGAIYTRYKNKDALFLSLLQDFLGGMEAFFAPAAQAYEEARQAGTTEALLHAIEFEERLYFELLTAHCEECTLFFSRSDGSSAESMLNELMLRKTEQTVEFFRQAYGKAPNADAIRLLMGSQFWYFRQLLNGQLEEARMLDCLHALLDFFNAGWRQLCDTLK